MVDKTGKINRFRARIIARKVAGVSGGVFLGTILALLTGIVLLALLVVLRPEYACFRDCPNDRRYPGPMSPYERSGTDELWRERDSRNILTVINGAPQYWIGDSWGASGEGEYKIAENIQAELTHYAPPQGCHYVLIDTSFNGWIWTEDIDPALTPKKNDPNKNDNKFPKGWYYGVSESALGRPVCEDQAKESEPHIKITFNSIRSEGRSSHSNVGVAEIVEVTYQESDKIA